MIFCSLRRCLRHFSNLWLKSLVSSTFIIAHALLGITHAYHHQIHLFPNSHAYGFLIAKDTSTRRQFIAFVRASGHPTPSPDSSEVTRCNAIHRLNTLYQMHHALLPLFPYGSPAHRSLGNAIAATKKQKLNGTKTEQRERPPYTTHHSNHRVSPQATLGATHQPNPLRLNCLG